MQIYNKKMIAAIISVLLMASITLMILPVNAQARQNLTIDGVYLGVNGLTEADLPAGVLFGWGTRLPSGVTPDVTYNTRNYINARPNPIGVGQTMLINLFYTPSSHRVYKSSNYTLTITKPDGSTVVFDARSWTSERATYVEYVPDQVGEYNLHFLLPDQYWPEGLYYDYTMGGCYNMTQSMYGRESETEITVTVQEEAIVSWPPSPLPTDYWTRPVAKEHREWWPILGAFPADGYWGGGSLWDEMYPGCTTAWSDRHHFHPYILAPNSAHIVWKKLDTVAGITGGIAGQYSSNARPDYPSLAYAGRYYMDKEKANGVEVAQCADIRTGEVYYEVPLDEGGMTPDLVTYVSPAAIDRPFYGTLDTFDIELLRVAGGRLYKINPWTGEVTTNVSIAPATGDGGDFIRQGDYDDENQHGPTFLWVQNLGNSVPSDQRYRLIKWTSRGNSPNFEDRIISNTSYARSSLPTVRDWEAGIGITYSSDSIQNTYIHTRINGYNLWTGQELWETIDPDIYYVTSNFVCDHGKVAVYMKQDAAGTKGGYYKAWNLADGKLAWTGEMTPYPWGQVGFAAYSVSSAYGKIILCTYAGVAAWDWDTGELAWIYQDPTVAQFESPYVNLGVDGAGPPLNVNPFFLRATIVDGKVFATTSEHGQSWPNYRGWGLRAIDVQTGELVWGIKIATGGTGFNSPPFGVVHDGYLVGEAQQDGYLYCFGKGKSATTVTAPDVSVPVGTALMVKGTVMDLSPAQPNTPCVSAESMSTWMEYLHLQLPIGGIWQNETITGVPVSLDAVDPNGNYVHIADVTTDGYSGTFGYAWTPDIPGQYTVTATFSGDESYGSSFAQTYVNVGEAPEQTPEPPAEEQVDYMPTLYGILAAVVVAIIIGVVALLFTLRK